MAHGETFPVRLGVTGEAYRAENCVPPFSDDGALKLICNEEGTAQNRLKGEFKSADRLGLCVRRRIFGRADMPFMTVGVRKN